MITIEVLASEAEAEQKLKHYEETNMRTDEAIYAVGKQRELEYKAASGFNERCIEQQNKSGALSRINPSLIALPQDEHNKVWSGVGAGFELHLLVELYYANGEGFGYRHGETFPPLNDYVHDNLNALPERLLLTMPELAQAIKQVPPKYGAQYFGAVVTPLFYTINGRRNAETPEVFLTPEQAKGFFYALLDEASGHMKPEEVAEASAALASPEFEARLKTIKEQEFYERGLTPEEISEFERLFNQ